VLGMAQPKLSNMLRGRFRGISEAKLMECLAAGTVPMADTGQKTAPRYYELNSCWRFLDGRLRPIWLKRKPTIYELGRKGSPEKANYSGPTNQAGAISRSAAMARKAERDCPRRRAASSMRPTRDSGRLMFTRTARERTLFRSISTRSQNPPR